MGVFRYRNQVSDFKAFQERHCKNAYSFSVEDAGTFEPEDREL
jgi:hypothetical protein